MSIIETCLRIQLQPQARHDDSVCEVGRVCCAGLRSCSITRVSFINLCRIPVCALRDQRICTANDRRVASKKKQLWKYRPRFRKSNALLFTLVGLHSCNRFCFSGTAQPPSAAPLAEIESRTGGTLPHQILVKWGRHGSRHAPLVEVPALRRERGNLHVG